MPFLGATCIDHGQASTGPTDECCPGNSKWTYDANTGAPYSGFMCWSALCAGTGQWAGPVGVGDHCCTPLVNVGGKCGTATTGNIFPPAICKGTLICSIPDMYLYIGIGLLAVMMMGKKKAA